MNQLIRAITALLMTACATTNTQDLEPRIVPLEKGTHSESLDYKIRINFLLSQSDTIRYPNTTKAFQEAIKEWCQHLPIEYVLFVEQDTTSIMISSDLIRMGFQPGIIKVQMLNLQGRPHYQPFGVAGFYDYSTHVLALDIDTLEGRPDVSRFVCLHELGHLFGLSHFTNEEDIEALSGNIVLPKTIDARSLLMYREFNALNQWANISDLEVSIARQTMLDLRMLPMEGCFLLTLR